MAYFKYLTRDGFPLPGKPRVYLSYHPEDFELFFSEITTDIFASQDCAIFYADPKLEYTEAELQDYFSHMQLFVIPITRNILQNPSALNRFEFDYALQHHVPVLPLVQEEEIDALFRSRFGDLQYLDKHFEDVSALSYKDKLKKYLDSVLIGKETEERIRREFKGSIFFSYRKKDRRQARDLMQLIHRNDFCREIAIWYDEFLTPGEDFNDSIQYALTNSNLFVLVVTPNIINSENYINTVEYPCARAKNIPVLPVEMEPTDRNALSDHYKGIPPCISAYDQQELCDGLRASFGSLEFTGEENNPNHTYLIGLAYLSGIDVEIDYDFAVKLITQAAENGHEEAIRKLISMYGIGEGVALDRNAQITWARNLVSIHKKKFCVEQNTSSLGKVFSSMSHLIEYLFMQGANTEAIAVADEELTVLKNDLNVAICRTSVEDESLRALLCQGVHVMLSDTETQIGQLLLSLDMLDEAEDYFLSANGRLLNMKNGCDDSEYEYISILRDKMGTDLSKSCGILLDIAQNYGFLGEIEMKRKRVEEALILFRKQIESAEDCIHHYPLEPDAHFALSRAITNITTIEFQINHKYDNAVFNYETAISILEKLRLRWASDPDMEHIVLADIATNHQHIAKVLLLRNEANVAEEHIRKALRINQFLVYEKDLKIYARNLKNDSDLLNLIMSKKKALIHSQTDVKGLVHQWENCDDPEFRDLVVQQLKYLYNAKSKQIHTAIQVYDDKKAKMLHYECLDIREFFFEKYPSNVELCALGNEHRHLASFLYDTGCKDESIHHYKLALESFSNLFEHSQSKDDARLLSSTSIELGKIYLLNGKLKQAFFCFKHWSGVTVKS